LVVLIVSSTGETSLCAVNRSAPYFLMAILLNLLTLLFTLVCDLKQWRSISKIARERGVAFAMGIPLLLLVIAYAVEGNDEGTDNEILNTARHSFTCSMRFSDMATEVIFV
jgi:hypothetical protein